MTAALAVNARFLTRPPTGVDRVARELIAALARRADIGALALLHPPWPGTGLRGAADAGPGAAWLAALDAEARRKVAMVPFGQWRGHVWEQLDLPRALRDRPLLSLCSTGPLLRRHHMVMIHDAQVWDVPQSYSRAFRLTYRLLLPVLARVAARVATVSRHSALRLERVGVVPTGRLRVVPNGADHILRVPPDPGTLERHGLRAGGYVLAIGSLAPHKNLRRLVTAAAARGPGAPPLVIAGGRAGVFADAGIAGGPGLACLGRVTDGELRALYEGALALAFPSLTEGFGLPPLEAMLCGCPVIATTGGAVPETCGEAALYVDPMDGPGWTAALRRVEGDAALRDALVRRGRDWAARFTWDAAAAELVEALP